MVLKRIKDDPPGVNLTPMIDIVFLLIIFFMVGTRFSELSESERDIRLQVPEVANAETLTAAPSKKVINVFENGSISLDDEMISLSDLKSRLTLAKSEYPELGVIVRGEPGSQYQRSRYFGPGRSEEWECCPVVTGFNQLAYG